MPTLQHDADDDLVAAAQGGDRHAFDTLVTRRRRELHAHCYRLLASPEDADDAVQEAMVRAWRGLPGFERRSSFRTWLFKIATHAALDVARRRRSRELPVDFGPSTEGEPGPETDTPWIGPYAMAATDPTPEESVAARESLELAYVATLQRLPVRQRAIFILREVLAFSAVDTAAILDVTVATVTSALQRARATMEKRRPATSQRQELEQLGDEAVRTLAARYATAIERGDLPALLALLTEDISWSMPPLASWYDGRERVSEFLTRFVFPEQWAHVTTSANGQLAVAGYLFESDLGVYVPAALDVLELRGGKVAAVTGFLTGEALSEAFRHNGLFERFGLPATLPAGGARLS